jgi:hypothetical protein
LHQNINFVPIFLINTINKIYKKRGEENTFDGVGPSGVERRRGRRPGAGRAAVEGGGGARGEEELGEEEELGRRRSSAWVDSTRDNHPCHVPSFSLREWDDSWVPRRFIKKKPEYITSLTYVSFNRYLFSTWACLSNKLNNF